MIKSAPDTREMQLLSEFLRQQTLGFDPVKMLEAMEWTVAAMRPPATVAISTNQDLNHPGF